MAPARLQKKAAADALVEVCVRSGACEHTHTTLTRTLSHTCVQCLPDCSAPETPCAQLLNHHCMLNSHVLSVYLVCRVASELCSP